MKNIVFAELVTTVLNSPLSVGGFSTTFGGIADIVILSIVGKYAYDYFKAKHKG